MNIPSVSGTSWDMFFSSPSKPNVLGFWLSELQTKLCDLSTSGACLVGHSKKNPTQLLKQMGVSHGQLYLGCLLLLSSNPTASHKHVLSTYLTTWSTWMRDQIWMNSLATCSPFPGRGDRTIFMNLLRSSKRDIYWFWKPRTYSCTPTGWSTHLLLCDKSPAATKLSILLAPLPPCKELKQDFHLLPLYQHQRVWDPPSPPFFSLSCQLKKHSLCFTRER